jgi:hypothetical protein
MAPDMLLLLSQFLSLGGLLAAGVVFVASYIIWEAPRFLKLFDEDVLKGTYPSYGKALDMAFLVLAFISLLFLILNLQKMPTLVHKVGYGMLLAAGIVGIPLIFLLGFFGRLFSRFDAKHEPHVLLVHTGMDFIHTLFYSFFVALVLPSVTLILSSIL